MRFASPRPVEAEEAEPQAVRVAAAGRGAAPFLAPALSPALPREPILGSVRAPPVQDSEQDSYSARDLALDPVQARQEPELLEPDWRAPNRHRYRGARTSAAATGRVPNTRPADS